MPTDRELLFGTDILLAEQAGGLDVRASASGDLALAQGNENIVQALALRLRVRRGELAPLGWPNYGSRLHELIGEPNNNRTRTMLMAHARTAITADPRVLEISRLEARILPGDRDAVRLEIDIQLISLPEPLNLVFDVRLGTA